MKRPDDRSTWSYAVLARFDHEHDTYIASSKRGPRLSASRSVVFRHRNSEATYPSRQEEPVQQAPRSKRFSLPRSRGCVCTRPLNFARARAPFVRAQCQRRRSHAAHSAGGGSLTIPGTLSARTQKNAGQQERNEEEKKKTGEGDSLENTVPPTQIKGSGKRRTQGVVCTGERYSGAANGGAPNSCTRRGSSDASSASAVRTCQAGWLPSQSYPSDRSGCLSVVRPTRRGPKNASPGLTPRNGETNQENKPPKARGSRPHFRRDPLRAMQVHVRRRWDIGRIITVSVLK